MAEINDLKSLQCRFESDLGYKRCMFNSCIYPHTMKWRGKLFTLGDKMGKHHDKVKEALEIRIKNTPQRGGFNTPGSMNKKKTGYVKRGKGR